MRRRRRRRKEKWKVEERGKEIKVGRTHGGKRG